MFKEYRISEIGEVIGGGTPSTKNEEYWNGDIPWISPKDLTGYTSVYISHGESNITEKGLNKSGTKLLPKNTVLFSSRAPIGYVALAANPICTNQGFKSIVCNEQLINPLYLYYYLKANLDYIKLFGSGATFPEISGSALRNIKINIFENVERQIAVANAIYKYDELIEVNNQRIKKLEQTAEELYKEWFVRFRFPNWQNTEFENRIPKGWKKRQLKEFIKFERGVSYSSNDLDDGGYVLLSMNNLKPYGGFIKDYSRKYCGKFNQSQIVHKNDLIMSITDMTQDRRIIGYTGLVGEGEDNRIISMHLLKLSSPLYDNIYLNCLFNYSGLSRIIAERATGTNVLGMTVSILNNVRCVCPDIELANEFVEKIRPLIDTIHNIEITNDNLIKQRDLLLPRLMSGKIKV